MDRRACLGGVGGTGRGIWGVAGRESAAPQD